MNNVKLKECYEVQNKKEAFYTGGNIVWSQDGEYIFCQNGVSVSVVSTKNGLVQLKLAEPGANEDDDNIHCFTTSRDCNHVVTHHKSGLFKHWNRQDGSLVKAWKSIHKRPVATLSISENGKTMASGGADGTIRLWNFNLYACTHNLRSVEGVVSTLTFGSNKSKNLLFGSGDNYVILGWNIKTGEEALRLEGHFSKVTSLSFHENGVHMISSGRDKVLILWDIERKVQVRIIPVYESIEDVFIIPQGAFCPVGEVEKSNIYAVTAGETGVIKIWNVKSGVQEYVQQNSLIMPSKEENGLAITHLLYNAAYNSVAVASTSHNIIIYSLKNFICKTQLVGYMDEILDIAYVGANESHVAVASNSPDIKLYELTTMSCQILCGHTNLVLSLSTTPANRNLLISSDKDSCVRLWVMDSETTEMTCVGIGKRHTAAIGSVAISQTTAAFFASVSQDLCLKIWDLPKHDEAHIDKPLNATNTVMGHDKDINSVVISPNDKLIATGSQDKTAKLWSAENLQLLGVFRGHRRGVWCVRFSPIDQVLATTSADCTIKLWSLTELNCLRTFQGHDSAVLTLEFLSRGMQMITSGGDGLLKLWCIKTSVCETTLDQHESRVWALAVNRNESQIISGGSDSLLITWQDTTEEKKLKEIEEKQETARCEQELANVLKVNDLSKALRLALKLGKPLQALNVINGLILKGQESLKEAICKLTPPLQEELLDCCVSWNTISRDCQTAMMVISVLLKDVGIENLNKTMDVKSRLDALIPYTERHFKRIQLLEQGLHLFDYMIRCSKANNNPSNLN